MNDRSLYERISSFIEASETEMIALESLLAAVPAIAPESGGVGEDAKAKALVDWLSAKGFFPEVHYAPDERVPSGRRPNVILTVPGERDESLWIMSHLDVVPPGEAGLWETDPYTVVREGGRIYGRGGEDNQQGIVASVFAVLALKASGLTPARTVKLLFVADEEVGSLYGIQWLLKQPGIFRKGDLFIVPDAGRPDATMIEVAEKSLLWLKFTTKGVQCHASRPNLGKNAFVAASALVLELDGLKDRFPQRNPIFEPEVSTFVPSKKEANIPNVNTLPGEDVFCCDCRILPEVPVPEVLAEIETRMRKVEKAYSVSISCEILQRVESKPTSEKAPLVALLKKVVKEVYGVDAEPVGVGGGTVGAYLRNEGYDTVVWARVEESAHMPNEYCVLENLKGDAKVMALAMLDKGL
jgi:succinyl-diaminopimelate desuccinylase